MDSYPSSNKEIDMAAKAEKSMKPNFQMSADTRFAVQVLSKAKVGDVLTFETLSAEMRRPVDGSCSAIGSARRILLRDKHMVFDSIRGVGIKRLNDMEIVATGSRTATKIRRVAQNGVRTLTAISDFGSMPRETQMRHTATVAVFGVIAEMSGERGLKKVEKITEGAVGALPISQTLAAFA